MVGLLMPKSNTYEEFVEKFKPKLTTDDCYTPEPVYDAIADWVANEYSIDRADFVRPFYPGGDFENYQYKPTDVVVDNPPFSILGKIMRFYIDRGIRFFLFAPCLTMFSTSHGECTALCVEARIVYENGAVVNTSFLTNLEDPEIVAKSTPALHDLVEDAVKTYVDQIKKHVPRYKYNGNVVTAAMFNYMAAHGVEFTLKRNQAKFVRVLDEQRKHKKTLFGGGFLISEKAAAEKAAAEKAAAEKADAIEWELSEREKAIVEELSRNDG